MINIIRTLEEDLYTACFLYVGQDWNVCRVRLRTINQRRIKSIMQRNVCGNSWKLDQFLKMILVEIIDSNKCTLMAEWYPLLAIKLISTGSYYVLFRQTLFKLCSGNGFLISVLNAEEVITNDSEKSVGKEELKYIRWQWDNYDGLLLFNTWIFGKKLIRVCVSSENILRVTGILIPRHTFDNWTEKHYESLKIFWKICRWHNKWCIKLTLSTISIPSIWINDEQFISLFGRGWI